MKERAIMLMLAAVMTLSLTACGNSGSAEGQSEPSAAPDLTGEWKQTNSNADDSWQSATIAEGTIEVYWVSDNGDTKSLYWAGTFTAPATADEPYSWKSENDHEKTDMALLASGDDTKEFTYKNGQISYSVSALGTTTTVRLEKER